jgi:hypothetical protein
MFFKCLVRTTPKTLFWSKPKRPEKKARLALEPLEARAVPAVGKWIPAPEVAEYDRPLGLEAQISMGLMETQIDSGLAEIHQDAEAAKVMRELEQLNSDALHSVIQAVAPTPRAMQGLEQTKAEGEALFSGKEESETQAPRDQATVLLSGGCKPTESSDLPLSPLDRVLEESSFHWDMQPDGSSSPDPNELFGPGGGPRSLTEAWSKTADGGWDVTANPDPELAVGGGPHLDPLSATGGGGGTGFLDPVLACGGGGGTGLK